MFGFGKPKTNKEIPSPQPESPSLLGRLKANLVRARRNLTDSLSALFQGRKIIDAELLEELETILIAADVGVETTQGIINELTMQVKRAVLREPRALLAELRIQLLKILHKCANSDNANFTPGQPYLILMVGVNGTGKTTTIGKRYDNV